MCASKKLRHAVEAEILADAAVDRERHVEALGFVIDFMKHRRAVERRSVIRHGR